MKFNLSGLYVSSTGEDQKVSPPDVAFYGLHVIIPLMSPEVLKVSSCTSRISSSSLLHIWSLVKSLLPYMEVA